MREGLRQISAYIKLQEDFSHVPVFFFFSNLGMLKHTSLQQKQKKWLNIPVCTLKIWEV